MAVVSLSFMLMFLVSIVSIPHFIDASSVTDACTKAAASSPTINRDFCVASLQADPKSGSANVVGLAQIATDLTSKNATSTKAKIQNLLSNPGNGNSNIKPELSTCHDLYSEMIGHLSDAASAISSFHYDDAKTYLSAALDAPSDCEDAFSEKGTSSVLSKENANATQLSAIALALLNI
jgi:pectinesterase inhibitor-like protein